MTDFSILDHPHILSVIFHPRREDSVSLEKVNIEDIFIPVEENVAIGGRFHAADRKFPTILFFHGNGEIVSDYDDIGPLFNHFGVNFFAVDYRGYGRSSGHPTVSAMMSDCHTIFEFTATWLKRKEYSGPLLVMGRSLGSASALELAACHDGEVEGLIVESGFAYLTPLLNLLGVDAAALGFDESQGPGNLSKIRKFHKPTLIIHAEFDQIIPFSEGKALFDQCPSSIKKLVNIRGADHNDIFARDMNTYLKEIQSLAQAAAKNRPR